MCGYNLIKDKQKYILCINDYAVKKDYPYSDIEKNTYIYNNPILGKFKVDYNETDYIW